ncbi:MAG: HEPN domain-containing protein [Tannerella sp.]|jgi:HEPN domain-containing protein|nr:HEPN domain-containing protein [Tannerella sp.]
MTKEEKIKYWTDLSERDLQVAEMLVNGKQFLWAGFMCHQVIEKIFKGYYTALTDETPPFRHELDLIAKRGEFYEMLSTEHTTFLDILNPLQIEARYPAYKDRISKTLNQAVCEKIWEQTKSLHQWTKEQILSIK